MAYHFIGCNREQDYLLPPSVKDWVPEGDLAWFVIDAVKEMDLGAFYEEYRKDGWGGSSFDPEMMVTLMLYSYCLGKRSSRRIERLCERDVGYRVITANQVPDHTTVARFRKRHREGLEKLFGEVLKLCAEAGMVKVGTVALDGTKMEANASLGANRNYEHIEREVKRMLDEADTVDEEEDRLYGKDKRGDELPQELRDPKSRLERLRACKERLEREAQEEAKKQEEKIRKREEEESREGQKKRGKRPEEPDPTPSEKAKGNVTDPDSRVMKTRKGYVQGYNAQAVVTMDQIIVAAEVTQEANDVNQLHTMVEKAQEEIAEAGIEEEIEEALADAGYCSEENLRRADPEGPELYVATRKDWKQRKEMRERPPPRGRIPKELSLRERMERKLLTKGGRALYKLRSQTVEPVFGQVKACRGCDRFMQRGKKYARSEWRLLCATHNLLKLYRRQQVCLN